ncbi:MAG TPA: hypothetical protein VK501_17540 [Baekduia sp.]|uniref:hypothetical protein n=1 Tax=Baekduia sp. TaxID=2600305 RepID=UPI002C599784|nr:hypothetical protein [Baekduia sp.]HMJ35715.1 hypothetical protein [Baekduia sp.]
MDDADPTVPGPLRLVLGAAAELELELASDGFWPDEPEARAEKRDRLRRAARTVDTWEADACSRKELATLAHMAAGEQEPGRWPRTIEEAAELVERAALTRDLILFRDAVGGKPTQEDLDDLM